MISTHEKTAPFRRIFTRSSTALALFTFLFSPPATLAQEAIEEVCNVPLFGLVTDQNNPLDPRLEDHSFVASGTERFLALSAGAQSFGLPVHPSDSLNHMAGQAIGYISGIPMTDTIGFAITTPLYHVLLEESSRRDSFYTIDLAEAVHARDFFGYDALGPDVEIVGHILKRTDLRPLFRLYSQARKDHVYTSSPAQRDDFVALGYVFEATIGSVLTTSQKLPMTDARTIFCDGGSAVRNPNGERSRFYFQGTPLGPGDRQTLSFDLWTGEYFTRARKEHLAILMWGDPDLENQGANRGGRGLIVGRVAMIENGAPPAQGTAIQGACLEFFNGQFEPGVNPPKTGVDVFNCMTTNDVTGSVGALGDEKWFHFEITATHDEIEYSILDENGLVVAEDSFTNPGNPVVSGKTEIFVAATSDNSDDPALGEASHLEIHNAIVTIERATGSLGLTQNPDSQEIHSGDSAFFSMAVTNTGQQALTQVTVTDAQAPDCDRTFSFLPAGQSRWYSCSRGDVTSSFTNIAEVHAYSANGPVSAAASSEVVVSPTPSPDLQANAISSLTPAGLLSSGGEPFLRASLRNIGDATATNIRAIFRATSATGSASLGSYLPPGCQLQPNPQYPGAPLFRQEYLCEIPNLAPNQSVQITWDELCIGPPTSAVPYPSLFVEAFFLEADQEDSDPSNDSASVGYFNPACP